MRCSGWSSLAISVCSALVLTGTAPAHVIATPTFVPSGSSESITLAAPNERDTSMTRFSITAPAGLEIAHADALDGWTDELDGATATWLRSYSSRIAVLRLLRMPVVVTLISPNRLSEKIKVPSHAWQA